MDLGLSGKVVLVSGASRGIGFAIAEAFAAENARVVLTARAADKLEAARERIANRYGDDAVRAIAADMSDETDIARVLATMQRELGAPDVVVANVGSGTARGGFDATRAEWEQGLSTNLLSGTLLASQALKVLTERKQGNLIFVSSIAGIEAIRAPVTYSAAKAALQMAAKLYAQQVGSFGVRVNVVAPGNILFPGGTWEAKLAERREYFEQYLRSEVALQRFGAPEEIADVVVFLASGRAGFTTGSVWVVDGGQTRSY